MLFLLPPPLGSSSAEERSPFEYLGILYSGQSLGLYKAKAKNNGLSFLCSQSISGIFSGRDQSSPRELIVVTSNVAVIQAAGRAL